MNKELTALCNLTQIAYNYSGFEKFTNNIKEYFEILENALERLENYEKNEDFYKDVISYSCLNEEDKIKKLKALNEILALHDKWLGNEMSDFEFFTLLNEARDKYGLLEEVLL